jgi:hypothetical protein
MAKAKAAKKKVAKQKVESQPVGRPRAIDEIKMKEILAFVQAGGSRTKAADYVGVSTTTIADEAARNPEFASSLKKAEADSYQGRVERIAAAGKKGAWQADAWFLERRYPDEFGKRVEIKQTADETPQGGTNIIDRLRAAQRN